MAKTMVEEILEEIDANHFSESEMAVVRAMRQRNAIAGKMAAVYAAIRNGETKTDMHFLTDELRALSAEYVDAKIALTLALDACHKRP